MLIEFHGSLIDPKAVVAVRQDKTGQCPALVVYIGGQKSYFHTKDDTELAKMRAEIEALVNNQGGEVIAIRHVDRP